MGVRTSRVLNNAQNQASRQDPLANAARYGLKVQESHRGDTGRQDGQKRPSPKRGQDVHNAAGAAAAKRAIKPGLPSNPHSSARTSRGRHQWQIADGPLSRVVSERHRSRVLRWDLAIEHGASNSRVETESLLLQ